ncbi:hypothetical protein GCM10027295_40080 [Pseudaeromonas pectinilytica]
MALREIGKESPKAKGNSSIPAVSAAMITSPEVGASMMAAGEAQIAVAAAREMPRLTISGNRVAIRRMPNPTAELTASDMAQATK